MLPGTERDPVATPAPGSPGAQPAGDAQSTGDAQPLGSLPQFEVIPLPGALDAVFAGLAPGSRVTVTASPAQGLPATLELAGALSRRGFVAIPHLAARMVRGAGEALEAVAQLAEAGVGEVFVIAGDSPRPAGELSGALELLEVLSADGPALRMGVGAHPEGHPFVDDAEAMRLLQAKAEHASYAVTQMCFEAAPLLAWTHRIREEGITLPVRPGIAAPVSTARLLRIGTRIGVGRSLRLLGEEGSGVRRLLGPGHWDPAPLLDQLQEAHAEDPDLALHAPHVYTFNDLAAARATLASR